MTRKSKNSLKALKNKRLSKTKKPALATGKKLYEALSLICSFYKLEDFLILKTPAFLKLCEVSHIAFCFKKKWLSQSVLKPLNSQALWPVCFSSPLIYKSDNYGDIRFFSSHKFSQAKKLFFKKITAAIASAFYFVEAKQRMEDIKWEWSEAFNSFSGAFCVTDKNFKIIRVNRAFKTMIQNKVQFKSLLVSPKKNQDKSSSGRENKAQVESSLVNQKKMQGLLGEQSIAPPKKLSFVDKNLLDFLPPSLSWPQSIDSEGSFLTKGTKKGETFCWEISFKPLFLKKEKTHALLFLIKDMTKEIELEDKISKKAKDKEIGFIKASIAHELNNPIAGIQTLLTVIENQMFKKKTSPASLKSLKDMQTAAKRCEKIVKNLLTASKTDKKPYSTKLPKF